MKYQSQRVAYYFFAVALLLLCLQIVYGFIMAFAHMGYDVLHDYIPFNTARATTTCWSSGSCAALWGCLLHYS